MCGRFCCSLNPESLVTKLHKDNIVTEEDIQWIDKDKYHPSYNVCPTRYIVTMYQDSKTKQYVLQPMQWGFIPSWSKSFDMPKPINARLETLVEKSIYDTSKQSKRCVIIAEGFYEWKKLSDNKRQPFFIKRKDGECMIFAGLYATNKLFGNNLNTCVIITTQSSREFASIHNRMPVILDRKDVSTWLDNSLNWSQPIINLLKPFKGSLDCYQVTDDVGPVKNDSPGLIVPIDNKKSSIFQFLVKQEPEIKSNDISMTDTKKRKYNTTEDISNKKKRVAPKITNFFKKK